MTQARQKLLRIALGFAFGVGVGIAAGHLVFSVDDRLTGIDLAGLFMAALLVGGGLLMLGMGSSGRAYATLSPDAEPGVAPDGGMLRFARAQGITNLLAGLTFAAPPLVVALGASEAWRMPLFAALAAVVAAECWANLRLYLDGDELVRAVVMRSGAICFWLLQFVFFLWAAAERMGLVAPVESWTLFVILMGTYILVGSVVAVRSGLANR